jgi:hypothetical protein
MCKARYLILFVALLFSSSRLSAQNPAPPEQNLAPLSTPATSRQIPIDLNHSHLPYGSKHNITAQLWDAPTGGNLIFSEVHTDARIGDDGSLHFLLGSTTTWTSTQRFSFGSFPLFGHSRRERKEYPPQ